MSPPPPCKRSTSLSPSAAPCLVSHAGASSATARRSTHTRQGHSPALTAYPARSAASLAWISPPRRARSAAFAAGSTTTLTSSAAGASGSGLTAGASMGAGAAGTDGAAVRAFLAAGRGAALGVTPALPSALRLRLSLLRSRAERPANSSSSATEAGAGDEAADVEAIGAGEGAAEEASEVVPDGPAEAPASPPPGLKRGGGSLGLSRSPMGAPAAGISVAPAASSAPTSTPMSSSPPPKPRPRFLSASFCARASSSADKADILPYSLPELPRRSEPSARTRLRSRSRRDMALERASSGVVEGSGASASARAIEGAVDDGSQMPTPREMNPSAEAAACLVSIERDWR